MTNQVNNVTETQNTELSAEEAYDKEWEDDDSSDQAKSDNDSSVSNQTHDSTVSGDQGKAEDTPTDSGTVAEQDQGEDDASNSGSAESSGSDDIWSDATEAQKLALKQAQNALNRESGRAKSQQQLNAELKKENDRLKAEHAKATRQKGTYESEHPELFDEVYNRVKTELDIPDQTSTEEDTSEDLSEDIKIVFKVHPDAHDLMQTPEWGAFAENLTPVQEKQFQADDPFEFIDLVTEFKTLQRIKAASPADELEATATGGGSSSSVVNKKTLTTEESYDAEWEMD